MDASYELFSAICHQGDWADVGHYTAYVKSSDDEWFLADDAYVTRENIPPDSSTPYLLFYRKTSGPFPETSGQNGISSKQTPHSTFPSISWETYEAASLGSFG